MWERRTPNSWSAPFNINIIRKKWKCPGTCVWDMIPDGSPPESLNHKSKESKLFKFMIQRIMSRICVLMTNLCVCWGSCGGFCGGSCGGFCVSDADTDDNLVMVSESESCLSSGASSNTGQSEDCDPPRDESGDSWRDLPHPSVDTWAKYPSSTLHSESCETLLSRRWRGARWWAPAERPPSLGSATTLTWNTGGGISSWRLGGLELQSKSGTGLASEQMNWVVGRGVWVASPP